MNTIKKLEIMIIKCEIINRKQNIWFLKKKNYNQTNLILTK